MEGAASAWLGPEVDVEISVVVSADPQALRSRAKTPVEFARHAAALAELFLRETGAGRGEAVEYLAALFLSPLEPGFARLAFDAFGPASGIFGLYPLEVAVHLVERHPWFLDRVGIGRFFDDGPREMAAGEPLVLKLGEHLRVCDFAVVAGGRPGYTFAPALEPGRYRLTIETPGEFSLLVAAETRSHHRIIERMRIMVRAEAPVTMPAPQMIRNAKKVAAWPKPAAPLLDHALHEEETALEPVGMSDDTREVLHGALLKAMGRLARDTSDLHDPPWEDDEQTYALVDLGEQKAALTDFPDDLAHRSPSHETPEDPTETLTIDLPEATPTERVSASVPIAPMSGSSEDEPAR